MRNIIMKGYSVKSDGNMYLPREGWLPENVENRRRYFECAGLDKKKIVSANLVHGTRVAVIKRDSPEFLLDTDALVTREKNIVLTLTGADCFPVYFEDAVNGIVGLVHCGWRGIIGGILAETAKNIIALRGTMKDTAVTIGPGICERHFEIQGDILPNFAGYPEAIIRKEAGIFVDLRAIMKTQLEQADIAGENIIDQNKCTCCLSKKYFSYRRDKPDQLETQAAYIVQ